jgi:outer membrane protein assembly factor BamE (lipoprotein component of BamABCDE complex)
MNTRVLAAAALALVAIWSSGCGYSPPKEDEWANVSIGMSKQEVIDRLGQPYMAQGSDMKGVHEDLYLYSDTTKYEKGKRYAYYAIRFENGRVAEKNRYLTKRSPEEVLAEINRLRAQENQRARAPQPALTPPPPPGVEGRAEPRAGEPQPAGVPQAPEKRPVGPEGAPLPPSLGPE